MLAIVVLVMSMVAGGSGDSGSGSSGGVGAEDYKRSGSKALIDSRRSFIKYSRRRTISRKEERRGGEEDEERGRRLFPETLEKCPVICSPLSFDRGAKVTYDAFERLANYLKRIFRAAVCKRDYHIFVVHLACTVNERKSFRRFQWIFLKAPTFKMAFSNGLVLWRRGILQREATARNGVRYEEWNVNYATGISSINYARRSTSAGYENPMWRTTREEEKNKKEEEEEEEEEENGKENISHRITFRKDIINVPLMANYKNETAKGRISITYLLLI
ncbi:hypothetical protein V1477_010825 [Vespula maculifrons]|uniref:Uncharacterized protein n=1 Tax=Vespula maculifrons TaxID=7453 RepID=A0ABD2C323_VESMC